VTEHRPGRRVVGVAGAALALALWSAPTAGAATAPDQPQPPKLDVAAAEQALTTQQIYRAPGAVAVFDERQVRAALTPDMRVLVEPFTGTYEAGHNYATGDDYEQQVYGPLSDWSDEHKLRIVDITGLYVRSYDGGASTPSDIPELRTQTAYLDVTSSVLGLIDYLKSGATHYPSPPGPALVPPTPAQLSALVGALRADPVYNAAGRTDPISQEVAPDAQRFGLPVRVAAFPPLTPGQPFVDYAPALAGAFPGDEIFVNYGQWMEVAGPNLAALQSARDYAYGRYEDATLEQGASMTDRIGTILARTSDLVRKHPFSRPQPTPFDLRHRISALAPWVLLGSAVVLAGGSLLAWQRNRAELRRIQRVELRRESALATAAIAALGARLLDADGLPTETVAAAAERRSTATAMFDQARTAAAMRQVRHIAEQGAGELGR
jgi:hypothetical protein